MTFAGIAAWQAWVLAAAAGAIAIRLFLLKVRPPRVTVPTLMLWTKVLNERREQTLWERIRRAVSLVITAIIALALAFAFTRPIPSPRQRPKDEAGRMLIVLDSSWSMLARTRSGETRWDRAVAEARSLAQASSGADVAVATTANGLVEGPTTDVTLIETALDRIAPAGGAGASLPRLSGADVHLITDGATARLLDPAVVVHSVYESAANAGITAFDVRPPLDGTTANEAYLEVANFGPAQQVRVQVTRGETSLVDQRVDMAAGESLHQVLRVARDGAPDLRAHITAGSDALAIDNDAFGWVQDARPLAVVVVGRQSAWLARALAATSGIAPTFVTPDAYHAGKEDVVIFDRYLPAQPPGRPALYVAPPPAPWLGEDASRMEQHPRWMNVSANPVLEGVDPLTFSIDRARIYRSATLQPIARSASGTTLVAVSDQAGQPRAVVLAFGPNDSNLTSAPGFPVLMGNALDWLGRPVVVTSHRTGRAAFDNKITRVSGPRGDGIPLLKLPGETSALLPTPGLYVAEAGSARTTFAVNITDPDVSNLQRSTTTGAGRSLQVAAGLSPRPWWIYLVVLALAGVLIEWWTWLRRITV